MNRQPLEALETAVHSFLAIHPGSTETLQTHRGVTAAVDELSCAIVDCEQKDESRDAIRRVVAPLREQHRHSPFIRRAQDWPRGYPGDFETIAYLYEAQNRADPQSLSYYLESFALQGPTSQQHRNKLHHQAELITRTVREHAGQTRILSLASSACIDLKIAMPHIRDEDFHLVVNDVDEDGLAAAERDLAPIADKCEMVRGNVLEVIRGKAEDCATFDLILVGGVFDYLSDKQMRIVLRRLNRMLAPGGTVFFTNVAPDNPYRPWLEYCGSWSLVERGEDDLRELVRAAGLKPEQLSIQRDPTGLTCLVEVRVRSAVSQPIGHAISA